MAQKRSELAEGLREHLAMIDSALGATKLSERPLAAARIVVEHFVKAVRIGESEESVDDYLRKPWFAEIFAIVQKWYEEKYGPALRKDERLQGVVEIHGLPFLVAVPATHSEVEQPGKSAWLCFSVDLGDSEDPFRWIASPPNIANMSSGQRDRLRKRLATLTRLLRTINLNLMMTEDGSSVFDGLRMVAAMSVRKVAHHLVTNDPIEAGSAVWEMHYALEAALKAIVAKHGTAPSQHHILKDLLVEARAFAPLSDVGTNPFAFLPSSRLAIEHRYGEKFSVANAMAIYERFLKLMSAITAPIRGNLDLSRSRLLIAAAPWLRVLLEEDQQRNATPQVTDSTKVVKPHAGAAGAARRRNAAPNSAKQNHKRRRT
jgi:hypothetical protein